MLLISFFFCIFLYNWIKKNLQIIGFEFHTTFKTGRWIWPALCHHVRVSQMEPVVPGSWAAAQPLCVVRAHCVLSAAVSNSQLTWQQHPRSRATADGGELAFCVCMCACLPISVLERQLWEARGFTHFWIRQHRGGQLKWNSGRGSHFTLHHLSRLLSLLSESYPWDYILAAVNNEHIVVFLLP